MARRRLELRPAGNRAALLLPRVARPGVGLFEYWRATGEPEARAAALRTAELFLHHRLFRSLATGAVIRREWLTLHYPPYWHYDILQALLVLSRM
jgi:predicted small integral membrane protein